MLTISPQLIHQIQAHLNACLPNEGCGLVMGLDNMAHRVVPIKNILESPARFRMDAFELLAALQWSEENHMALLAIFHSHPSGDCNPSPTDLNEYLYPDSAMLIFSNHPRWQMKAFKVKDGRFEQIPLQLA